LKYNQNNMLEFDVILLWSNLNIIL
jgi:hypothetical protein